jgi:hypothetical protein
VTPRNATAELGARLERVENFPRATVVDAFGHKAYRLAQALPSNLQRTPGDIREIRQRGIPRRRGR